jgi:hypothetical protein
MALERHRLQGMVKSPVRSAACPLGRVCMPSSSLSVFIGVTNSWQSVDTPSESEVAASVPATDSRRSR